MGTNADQILKILDRCCDDFRFPMLDNGYVYLAATRLTLFRSPEEWALVIECFGFSPRSGLPDIHLYAFGSGLVVDRPYDDSQFVYPVEEGAWQDEETVGPEAKHVVVRGKPIALPDPTEYPRHGIELENAPEVRIFELCRYLAAVAREDVLASPAERRAGVKPALAQMLQLEEWNHPDVVDEAKRPSGSETFQQLARALEAGDVDAYRPSLPANTHWSNWPDGGTL